MTREEAIARIKDHKIVHKMNEPRAIYISKALDMAIEVLEQEPCSDAISRQAALDAMDALWKEDIEAYGCDIPEGFDGKRAKQAINALPPVQPIRQRGHWIRQTDDYHDYYECEHCGIAVGLDDIKNYCPNCGYAMVEPQKSEEVNG